jgi:hypothetical protein
MPSMLRAIALPAVAMPLVLSLAGCGALYQKPAETMMRSAITGSENAPEWVRGAIPSSDYEISFVGRGGAYNVLDERKAFDEAFQHARQQLAEYVATHVISEACDKDWADGIRFIPLTEAGPGRGERPGQELRYRVHQLTDAIVGELLPKGQYWEQWQVDENPSRSWDGFWFTNPDKFEIRRYKCWVLASIRRDRVEKFVDATLKKLQQDAEIAALQAKGQTAEQKASDLQAALQASNHEVQSLRERIHYGRAFRLTTKDCCEIDDPCVMPSRPMWRTSNVSVDVQVTPAPAKPTICETMPTGGR